MVDLTEICGESALHTSLLKKRAAAQAKLDVLVAKANEKIAPLEDQIAKLDAMIAILVPATGTPAADTAADVPAFLKRAGV